MKVVRAEFAPFSLRLRRPLATAQGTIQRRAGFVLRLHAENGLVGLGEASPAHWVGGEGLEATERALAGMVGGAGPDGALASSLSRSAACALETALLDLEARASGLTASERLGGPAPKPIRCSVLLVEATLGGLVAETERALEDGARSLKLKVGGAPAEDLRRVECVRRVAGPTVAITLDANRAWSFDEARGILEAFSPFEPALVEEPLRSHDLGELARLRAAACVPIAVDESLRDLEDVERVATEGAADVVVLKLARLGGPRSLMAIAGRAQAVGLRVVLTDSIETAIGRSAVMHAACALSIGDVGLGGIRLLAEDVDGGGSSAGAFTPRGPGLGVTLAPGFERSLRWHA